MGRMDEDLVFIFVTMCVVMLSTRAYYFLIFMFKSFVSLNGVEAKPRVNMWLTKWACVEVS